MQETGVNSRKFDEILAGMKEKENG
jgi:hypothetical protein